MQFVEAFYHTSDTGMPPSIPGVTVLIFRRLL